MQTVAEINQRIEQVKQNSNNNKTKLEELRTKRAALALAKGGIAEIAKLDARIDKVMRDISNAPHELKLLSEQLAEEQAKEAQNERDSMLEGQHEIVNDIERLSKNFIETLQAAVNVNEMLLAALSSEQAVRAKTGEDILSQCQWCHGSQESLEKLLSLMQYQMQGVHTQPVGPGIVSSGQPIRL